MSQYNGSNSNFGRTAVKTKKTNAVPAKNRGGRRF